MFVPRSFYLLTAPPAWGKTRLFRQWVHEYPRPFLYISPLRALANEVKAALADHPGLLELKSKESWQQWASTEEHAHIMVVTPEQLRNFSWTALAELAPHAVVVWDELHLTPLWGFAFRESMLEQWWGYCESGLNGVGLTATADEMLMTFLQDSFEGTDYDLLSGDAGNFTFKTTPTSLQLPMSWLEILLEEVLLEKADNTLVFCAHRAEVDTWVKHCHDRGIPALGCKGGETTSFQQQLSQTAGPIAIFATSCLSHGVNLPTLARVILFYRETNPALVHQMLTRGGRRGESYQVWQVGWPNSIQQFFLWGVRILLAQAWLSVGEWWHGTGRSSYSSYSTERT